MATHRAGARMSGMQRAYTEWYSLKNLLCISSWLLAYGILHIVNRNSYTFSFSFILLLSWQSIRFDGSLILSPIAVGRERRRSSGDYLIATKERKKNNNQSNAVLYKYKLHVIITICNVVASTRQPESKKLVPHHLTAVKFSFKMFIRIVSRPQIARPRSEA